jgi:hypothetical protein
MAASDWRIPVRSDCDSELLDFMRSERCRSKDTRSLSDSIRVVRSRSDGRGLKGDGRLTLLGFRREIAGEGMQGVELRRASGRFWTAAMSRR